MEYPKALMTIKELETMGYKRDELLEIYRSRAINRNFRIACKMSDAPNSPIKFDTEALEKYRRSRCTGE